MTPWPRVSIVVPCFNKREYTARCLESLEKHTSCALSWEVICVDNASTDGTGGWLTSLAGPRLRVIRNEANLGFAAACNQGASASRGELLLFLNNDTEAHPGWLEPLVRTLESDESVGVVGSKLLYPDGTVQHAGMAVKLFHPGELIRWDHLHRRSQASRDVVNYTREFQAVTGASLLIRRPLFDALGGFDEGYVNGWEDVDLCLRVRRAGYRVIYQPQSVLTHHESISAGRFDRERPNAERFLALWGGQVAADEPALLRADGLEEQAQLCELQAALRADLCRFVPIPDLFPEARQPMLVTDPPGWRGRLLRLLGVRLRTEQRLVQIHLFQCVERLAGALSRLSLERAR